MIEVGFGLISCQRFPGDARGWPELYAQALELCEEAERLGFESVWTTEHHFVDDGYMPSLLPMSAAIAARTTRVRIGTGVLLAPLYHPLRLAEDAATVDLISGERLVLGLGLGWSEVEFAALGADRRLRGRAMTEILAILRTAWTGDVISHHGRVYDLPEVAVRPVPERHIPMWIGAGADPAVRRAGRLADGLYSNQPPDRFLQQVGLALDELSRAGRDPGSFSWAYHAAVYPCQDPERGWEELRPYVIYGRWKYSDMEASARRGPGALPRPPQPSPEQEALMRAGVILGRPDEIAERLNTLAHQAGVPLHFICRSYFPGMPYDQQVSVMQAIAKDVVPLLD